jgi:hypothetical protein
VLAKIDDILAWEQAAQHERDTRFVELGRYLCEVRSGQYWRLDHLSSFDQFLEKKFPESRRKAYYLMAIHERLRRIPKRDLKEVGWTKATELAKLALSCLSWKWRKRSSVKITERTHEEATEALHVGREGRHSEEAFSGRSADLGSV